MKKSINRDLRAKRENIKWEYDVVYELYIQSPELFGKNLEKLKQKVNLKCQDGWIPEGSLSIVEHGYSKYLCQTVIRPIVESNEKESNQKVADRAYIDLEYDGEE